MMKNKLLASMALLSGLVLSVNVYAECREDYQKEIDELVSSRNRGLLKAGLSTTGGVAVAYTGFGSGAMTVANGMQCANSSNGGGCTSSPAANLLGGLATSAGLAGGIAMEFNAAKISSRVTETHKRKNDLATVVQLINLAEMGDGQELRDYKVYLEEKLDREVDLLQLSDVIVEANYDLTLCQDEEEVIGFKEFDKIVKDRL